MRSPFQIQQFGVFLSGLAAFLSAIVLLFNIPASEIEAHTIEIVASVAALTSAGMLFRQSIPALFGEAMFWLQCGSIRWINRRGGLSYGTAINGENGFSFNSDGVVRKRIGTVEDCYLRSQTTRQRVDIDLRRITKNADTEKVDKLEKGDQITLRTHFRPGHLISEDELLESWPSFQLIIIAEGKLITRTFSKRQNLRSIRIMKPPADPPH